MFGTLDWMMRDNRGLWFTIAMKALDADGNDEVMTRVIPFTRVHEIRKQGDKYTLVLIAPDTLKGLETTIIDKESADTLCGMIGINLNREEEKRKMSESAESCKDALAKKTEDGDPVLKNFDYEDLEAELRRRGYVFFLRKADIATACDQSKGLLTDECVDRVINWVDNFETSVATVVTEYLEDLLRDYDKNSKEGLQYA